MIFQIVWEPLKTLSPTHTIVTEQSFDLQFEEPHHTEEAMVQVPGGVEDPDVVAARVEAAECAARVRMTVDERESTLKALLQDVNKASELLSSEFYESPAMVFSSLEALYPTEALSADGVSAEDLVSHAGDCRRRNLQTCGSFLARQTSEVPALTESAWEWQDHDHKWYPFEAAIGESLSRAREEGTKHVTFDYCGNFPWLAETKKSRGESIQCTVDLETLKMHTPRTVHLTKEGNHPGDRPKNVRYKGLSGPAARSRAVLHVLESASERHRTETASVV